MKDTPNYKQAELMLKTILHVAAERCFALKGGTTINLFVRDMPRLSVDIDPTYLPADDRRDTALGNMSAALDHIAIAIKYGRPRTRVQEAHVKNPDRVRFYPNNLCDTADFDFVSVLFRLSKVVRGL